MGYKFKLPSKEIHKDGRYLIVERLDTDGMYELLWHRADDGLLFLKTHNRLERMYELLAAEKKENGDKAPKV